MGDTALQKRETPSTGDGYEKKLRFNHCTNGEQAVIAAYVEELEENDKKDQPKEFGRRAWTFEDNLLVPDFDEILREPPAHSKLEAGTGEHEEAEGPGGFLFLGLGLIFSWP